MSELFLQIAVSLDGYIEDENGDIGWMVDDPSIDGHMTATLRTIDGMIFGRRSHELLAGFWPTAAESEGASAELIAQAELMASLPKYVLTHGKDRTGWTNSHAITVEDVPRLKRESARPIALYAGASAAQSLLHLVDEIRLIQYPLLLGGGTPLFPSNAPRRQLRLTGVQQFPSGATLQRFRPA